MCVVQSPCSALSRDLLSIANIGRDDAASEGAAAHPFFEGGDPFALHPNGKTPSHTPFSLSLSLKGGVD